MSMFEIVRTSRQSSACDPTTNRELADAELSAVSGGEKLEAAIRSDLDATDAHKALYLLYRRGTKV
jgi:hypothetical protein